MYHIICVISYEPYDLTHIIWADIIYKIWVFYDCILRPLGPRIDKKSSKSRKRLFMFDGRMRFRRI